MEKKITPELWARRPQQPPVEQLWAPTLLMDPDRLMLDFYVWMLDR